MPSRIALIDLQEDRYGCNNKEPTGTYGSVMDSSGIAGNLFHFLKKRWVRLPLLAFGYVTAILRKAGHRVTIDTQAPEAADLVLIATSIVGHRQEISFARALKKKLRCTIGFCGAFARAQPDLFLDAGDFVIDGEPDAWALQFDALAGYTGTLSVGRVSDLDALPFPDWHGFPIQQYSYRPMLRRRPFLTALASRGCPFACTYCPYMPIQGSLFRKRDVDDVVEEIEYLHRDFGARSILFRDINFATDRDRARRIAEGLITRRIPIQWGCETRSDGLDRELILLMKRAGLRSLHLGVETPSAETLKKHGRRPTELRHLEDVVDFSEHNGIKVVAFHMIGFRDDTEESVRRTIDYAARLNTSLAQFCVVTPYPGTPFHDEVRAEGRLLGRDWSEYTTYNPVMRLDHLGAEDVLRLKRDAYHRFFLRPSWIFKRGLGLLTH